MDFRCSSPSLRPGPGRAGRTSVSFDPQPLNYRRELHLVLVLRRDHTYSNPPFMAHLSIVERKCNFVTVDTICNGWLFFFSAPFTCKHYQVLCLTKLDGVIVVNRWYPTAVNAIWLPHSMDAVVVTIKERKLSNRPNLHQLILTNIGELVEKEGSMALVEMFGTDMEAYDYFEDKVIEIYLVTESGHLKRSQRRNLVVLVSDAKEVWMRKRNEHRLAELYLGRLPFHKELKRCCGEFYSSLKRTWGCCPLKVDFFKYP